ncbi:MAG: hypothetical protein IT563_24800 [Alphaproteobacteria bacterium]|nr:hypothetical protein [Alphaproteobacteria bacterium]
MRGRIDAELVKPREERSASVIKAPTATAAIERVKTLRLAAEFTSDSAEALMAAYGQIKHNLWVISEFAGRQRALIGARSARRSMRMACATSGITGSTSSRQSRSSRPWSSTRRSRRPWRPRRRRCAAPSSTSSARRVARLYSAPAGC